MTTATLDKTTYPLMMHLSILPKYDLHNEQTIYDAETQTSNTNAMAGSWSTKSASSNNWGNKDDDSKQDD